MSAGTLAFQDPWVLGLLALLPLVAWWRHRRRAYGELTYSSLPGRSGGALRLHLPFYLRLLGLALLVVAAARPQLGLELEEILTEGIDIQLVLDVSGSMAAEDFQPRNRLTVAKQVIDDFVTGRSGDRIGMVVFAGEALTKAPLTTDQQVLHELIDSVELYTLPDGTAIGMALASAASRLKDSTAKSKIVILVTDGVNNQGAIDPDSAAAVCEGLGIKVYTVGVGTSGEVPVPVLDRFGRMRRQRVRVEVDEELLKKIAERTHGQFFEATDPEALKRIFGEIDQLEKTEIESKRYTRYKEAFQPFVAAALALILAPLLMPFLGWTAEP